MGGRRSEQGVVDADLGGEVIKQRIARSGQGAWIPEHRVVSAGRAGVLRAWVCEEPPGQHPPR